MMFLRGTGIGARSFTSLSGTLQESGKDGALFARRAHKSGPPSINSSMVRGQLPRRAVKATDSPKTTPSVCICLYSQVTRRKRTPYLIQYLIQLIYQEGQHSKQPCSGHPTAPTPSLWSSIMIAFHHLSHTFRRAGVNQIAGGSGILL